MTAKKHSRTYYIVLSMLILPGAGQCAMKKWGLGISFALGFLGCAITFLLTLFIPLLKNVLMLTNFDSAQTELVEVAWPRALCLLGATVIIYAANAVDIVIRSKKDEVVPTRTGFSKDVPPEGPVPPGPHS